MKKTSILFLLGIVSVYGHAQNTYFLSSPSLSPDGNTAYFSYSGDIWKVSSAGGVASRVTALEGLETNPRVSPDGKWLAFSSNQYGNNDVYVMPIEGGEIKQLTYHTGNDEMESWSWDSKTLFFTSNRKNNFATYQVFINGGTPEALFSSNYFDMNNGLVQTPAGEYIFTTSTESANQVTRKHYKGENNPDLFGYDTKTKKYQQYTTYEGKDFNPTVDRNGNIYFISDENNGEYNLYKISNGVKTALTKFKTSIKKPFVAANGSKVIFEKDYQLFIYDPSTGSSNAIHVNVNTNKALEKEQSFDVDGKISYFDVSPDGKKMAFVSRGVLFVSDVEGKFIAQISDGKERVMEVKWLKDNRTLLFSQTYKGYQNWFTISADGKGTPKQITADLRNNRDITLDSKLENAVYLSGRDEVRLMDLKSLKSQTIVRDEIWAFQNSKPSFSPNGDYVLFTAKRNFEDDIFVYNKKTNQTINLTNTGVSEDDPVWSPDGRYIYFSSDRTNPSYPLGGGESNIYRMSLDWFDQPYRSSKFEDLFKEKEEETKSKDKKKKDSEKDSATTSKPIEIVVNPEDILERIERVTGRFGYQSLPQVFSDSKKDYLFYNSNQDEGRYHLYRKTFQDFEDSKTDKIFERGMSYMIRNKDNIYALIGSSIYKFALSSDKPTKIDIKYKFTKDLSSEFHQMFYETWAGLEENYYDENFHGIDWAAIKSEYEKYLPYVTNRNDLRNLLNDMLGELNSSHMGFYSTGSEESKRLNYVTNETGITFKKDQPFVVEEVLRKSPAFLKDVDIRKGDKLVAINNVKLDEKNNRESYFTTPAKLQELTLEFLRNGKKVTTKIHPITSGQLKNLLYDQWIYQNRKKVDEQSNNRIAYAYMKNMSTQALDQFLLDMVEQESRKQGLILDLRYNTGGNVHDRVLNFLQQRPYLQWKYREGKITIQPNFAPSGKPIVLLVNQYSLSDAEMTSAGFKALKLGKIIGTETYRWIIFTSAKGLVDGSSYRLPSWGTYSLDGKDLEKTGVTPDIYVKNTFLDLQEGKDPQLDRAIQEVLKEMK